MRPWIEPSNGCPGTGIAGAINADRGFDNEDQTKGGR